MRMASNLPDSQSGELAGAPQFRLWHLFALMAWCGAVVALYQSLPPEYATLALIAVTSLGYSAQFGVLAAAKTLAVIFFLGAFYLLLAPVRMGSHPAGSRATCINNLKNIVLALQNYESRWGSFPPAYVADSNGKPMHSWRVLILPYLDRVDLYRAYRFDEPWDGPNNRLLHSEMVDLFACPKDVRGPDDMHTSYVAVLGEHTAWPGAQATSVAEIEAKDGGDRTILLVETHDSGIHWMEPRDIQLDWCITAIDGPLAGSRAGTHGNHETGGVVGFVDGHVTFLEKYTQPATLESLFITDDDGPPEAPK